jgi:hypothetical protein
VRPTRELKVVKIENDLRAVENVPDPDRDERSIEFVSPEAQELHQPGKVREHVIILIDVLLEKP